MRVLHFCFAQVRLLPDKLLLAQRQAVSVCPDALLMHSRCRRACVRPSDRTARISLCEVPSATVVTPLMPAGGDVTCFERQSEFGASRQPVHLVSVSSNGSEVKQIAVNADLAWPRYVSTTCRRRRGAPTGEHAGYLMSGLYILTQDP